MRDDAVGTLEDDDRLALRRSRACLAEPVAAIVTEQAGKFAPMRRDDRALQPIVARLADQGERIGIDHQSPAARQHGIEPGTRIRIAPQAGADHERADPIVLDHIVAPEPTHQRMRRNPVERAGQFDIAGAGALRGGCSQQSRTAHRAGHDQHLAAAIFVIVDRGLGQARPRDFAELRLRCRQPDLADRHPSAGGHRGQQPMCRLECAQRHGQVEIGHGAEQPPRIGIDPAGQVDRDAAARQPDQTRERRRGRVVQPARKPGAEQGVDQERCRLRIGQFADRSGPVRGGLARSVGARRAETGDPHVRAAFSEQPRDDIAVAAIIARPAQDERVDRPRDPPGDVGDRRPGALHQGLDRNAGRDQRILGSARFRRSKDRPSHQAPRPAKVVAITGASRSHQRATPAAAPIKSCRTSMPR